MGGMQNIPGIQQSSTPTATQEDNPIKSLLRQLNVNANGHPQTSHIDTVWPQPPPQINPQFNAQNWLAQVCETYYLLLSILGKYNFINTVNIILFRLDRYQLFLLVNCLHHYGICILKK